MFPRTWLVFTLAAVFVLSGLFTSTLAQQAGDSCCEKGCCALVATNKKAEDLQVVVETRFVTTSDAALARRYFKAEEKSLEICFLNEPQVAELLQEIQKNPRISLTCAPKVTALDGQSVVLSMQDKQRLVTAFDVQREGDKVVCKPRTEEVAAGLCLQLRPTLSADRRFVRVECDVMNTTVEALPGGPASAGEAVPCTFNVRLPEVNTQRINKCLSIPTGGTAVMSAWTMKRVGRNENGPPILTKVPYVNRLFKNTCCNVAEETTYLLVTPRLINAANETVAVAPPAVLPKQLTAGAGNDCCCQKACQAKTACCQETIQTGYIAPPPAAASSKHVDKILELYYQACAAGQHDLAKKLAQLALDMDATCFNLKQSNKPAPSGGGL